MPELSLRTPGAESRPPVKLVRESMTLGVGADVDIPVADPAIGSLQLLLEKRPDGCRVSVFGGEGAFFVSGRKVREHTLQDGQSLRVGATEVQFHLTLAPAPSSPGASRELAALQGLYALSERMSAAGDVGRVIEAVVDHVIETTRADKGFLVLVEGGALHVKVARNMDRQNISDAVERLSDSIVQRVLSTKKPLIVSDALHDDEFNASESVVNLKLCSVMCVPLLERGGEPLGLIYVGNDRTPNLFERRDLEVLSIHAAQASLLIRNALLLNELQVENRALRKDRDDARFGEIIGACDAMRDIYRRLEKIAPTDISVLITGETGTGKELIARELHRRSPRKGGPFITINCGAIPENLLESELFGHVKGAFTGAVATRIGRFQAANGGTLFLDEVGELPVALQVKLLRALQEKSVTKVGDTRSETVDIRILAATNRRIEEEIKAGRFREDLYYRLNVVGLHLPPLRERGDDVEVIARALLGRFVKEFDSKARSFASGAVQAVRRYAWPGNIRQMENRIKKAVVLAEGPSVTADDLDLRPETLEPILPLQGAVERFKERYIDEVLARNNDNRTKTARDLGVDARTVFRYLERKRARAEGRAVEDIPEDEPAGDA